MDAVFTFDTLTSQTLPVAQSTGKRKPARQQRLQVNARYDAATLDQYNSRHFAMADNLSARQANSPGVRERLRNFSRYEVANNCYARGIVNTLADVEVGYGPVLHLPRPRQASRRQRETLKTVERLFEDWAIETGLWEKLWTMRVAKCQDGEAFGVFRTNPRLDSMVQLDVQLVEAEQCTHGAWGDLMNANQVDGVNIDDFGNPITYYILREHPGDTLAVSAEPLGLPAANVLHWFRCDRPGQLRGIPEITPALPLFSQLRRYTLATLTAAETAADIAAVIKSNITPEYDEDESFDALNYIDIVRGQYMELPDGREIQQLKAEQPTTTYMDFKRELLAEIGRCLNMPRAIALADASNYNYASGRLDRQAFDRYVETARTQCERQVLRKVWAAWWYEASKLPGYLPRGAVGMIEGTRPHWLWRVLGHVDRAKEEAGVTAALLNGTTTRAEECGKNGMFWEDAMEQRLYEEAREQEMREELGLGPAAGDQPSGSTTSGDTEEETEDEREEVEFD